MILFLKSPLSRFNFCHSVLALNVPENVKCDGYVSLTYLLSVRRSSNDSHIPHTSLLSIEAKIDI